MGRCSLDELVDEAGKRYKQALDLWPFRFGTDVLYRMCEAAPTHVDVPTTISKLWLIGRSYAAALERRRDKATHQEPYLRTARALQADRAWADQLEAVRGFSTDVDAYGAENVALLVQTVDALAEHFNEHTGLRKTSLASKYIHFHQPRVPIYDSYSDKALTRYVGRRDVPADLSVLWTEGKYGRHVARFVTALRTLAGRGFNVNAAKLDIFLLHLTDYSVS